MPEVSCRYFQRGFTDNVAEDDRLQQLSICTHPRLRRDNPDCPACIVPLLAKQELCPGLAQRFDRARNQFRYRCTIHKVKIEDPFSTCRSLRTCPLDHAEPVSLQPSTRQLIQITEGSVAAAVARRLAAAQEQTG